MGHVELNSFHGPVNAAIIGASGGIGGAFAQLLQRCPNVGPVYTLSRTPRRAAVGDGLSLALDFDDPQSISDAAATVERSVGSLDLVITATGTLHDGDRLQPEKTWRAMTASAMETAFQVNAIGPALVAKHFLPLLAKGRKSVFAALSARVGSIEDNRLGGWYAYRASKAALNMLIKTLSIELARRNPEAICVGLHPGTVDTPLSKPFQGTVARDALFSPEQSARHLLHVLDGLTPGDTGGVFAWDGARLPA